MSTLLACWMPNTVAKAGTMSLPLIAWQHMLSPRVAASPTNPSPIFTHSTTSCTKHTHQPKTLVTKSLLWSLMPVDTSNHFLPSLPCMPLTFCRQHLVACIQHANILTVNS